MNDSITKEFSLAQQFAQLPKDKRDIILEGMSPKELQELSFNWRWWGRPKQLRCFDDTDWSTYLYLCGRGFGKTRNGTEWVKHIAETYPGVFIAVVGPTTQSVNRTLVEGSTGLMNICPPGSVKYERTKAQIRWHNGSVAMLYSAEKPDRLRGPNHHFALADEIVAWKNPETWDMLQFTLRIGKNPRTLVTTTPKPTDLILRLIGGEDNVAKVNSQDYFRFKDLIVTRGTTFENTALSKKALENYVDLYHNTVMGDQELYAKLLINIHGALWKKDWIQHFDAYSDFMETGEVRTPPVFVRTVVAVDPATTANSHSDQTGIAVVSEGEDGLYYIRECFGMQVTPSTWAEEVVKQYKKYNASKIIAERNNGGLLVENTLRQVNKYTLNKRTYTVNGQDLPIETVHAKQGKFLRAEEVALLYEQRRVVHMETYSDLESQMLMFKGEPNGADDLVDAMVYGMRELTGTRIVKYHEPSVGGYGLVSGRMQGLGYYGR